MRFASVLCAAIDEADAVALPEPGEDPDEEVVEDAPAELAGAELAGAAWLDVTAAFCRRQTPRVPLPPHIYCGIQNQCQIRSCRIGSDETKEAELTEFGLPEQAKRHFVSGTT